MATAPKKWVRDNFKRLGPTDFTVTSPVTDQYNCIAWAMGCAERWWWPTELYHWPAGVRREVTVEAFAEAFATVGFLPCETGALEDGFEKAVLYTKSNGEPTHAAFLKGDGKWASKLGTGFDIEHRTPHGLGGGSYGEPTHYFRRPHPIEARKDTSFDAVERERAAKTPNNIFARKKPSNPERG